jgi:ECF sigma factor
VTTPPSTRQAVTQLLGDWSDGDDGALEKLFPLVQSELHRLAHHYMSRECAGIPCKPLPFSTKLICGWSIIRSRSGKAGATLSRRPRSCCGASWLTMPDAGEFKEW